MLSLLAGFGLSFIQAPYNFWFLIAPCFGLFFFLYNSLENKKQVFALSFLFGLGYFVTGLNWIGNALLIEGNDYKWVWPLAVIALPTLLSLFTALFVTINFILFKYKPVLNFFGFCILLSISEYVRGYAFTGFPWNLYGYGVASIPELSQSLSIIGPYGLTFLTIFWGAFLGFVFTKSSGLVAKTPITLLVILSISLAFLYGQERLKIADTQYNQDIEVHIIQPNIEQSAKWKNENLVDNFERHITTLDLPLDNNKKHIVIWPETAVPPILLSSAAAHQRIQNMLGDNALLLSGGLVMEPDEISLQIKYYNSLLAWTNEIKAFKLYSKSHLVPFGEYIPFQRFIPIQTVTQFSGFERGSGAQTITPKGYPSFSPLICYEIIFPNKVVNKHKKRPDYIVTITNDGWYGDSAGPRQHFEQARFRAIEQGIPVLRSANTGISGIIDAYGKVIAKQPLMTRGEVISALPMPLEKITLYGQYGDLIYILSILSGLILCLVSTLKKLS